MAARDTHRIFPAASRNARLPAFRIRVLAGIFAQGGGKAAGPPRNCVENVPKIS